MLLGLAALVILAGLSWFGNSVMQITRQTLSFKELPGGFRGYKIIQVSDLHGKRFGTGEKSLLQRIKPEKPDLIVITGDTVDKRNYDDSAIIELVHGLQGVAPIYFVTGNHEWWTGNCDLLKKKLSKEGVLLLENNSMRLRRDDDEIALYGMEDPFSVNGDQDKYQYADQALSAMKARGESEFAILLSHRPELFRSYVKGGYDLVFSGHAHGGQIRLPVLGAVVAPNQGFFPKYTEGVYEEGATRMVVSRGLGNSIIPQRVFNRPELVVVTLEKGE